MAQYTSIVSMWNPDSEGGRGEEWGQGKGEGR